jgi:hypothetical protein
MSSNEEDYGQESYGTKKRRVQRACDVCRRRKSTSRPYPTINSSGCSIGRWLSVELCLVMIAGDGSDGLD